MSTSYSTSCPRKIIRAMSMHVRFGFSNTVVNILVLASVPNHFSTLVNNSVSLLLKKKKRQFRFSSNNNSCLYFRNLPKFVLAYTVQPFQHFGQQFRFSSDNNSCLYFRNLPKFILAYRIPLHLIN
jgi:hypothetical protein